MYKWTDTVFISCYFVFVLEKSLYIGKNWFKLVFGLWTFFFFLIFYFISPLIIYDLSNMRLIIIWKEQQAYVN